jgi:hypothetical protein
MPGPCNTLRPAHCISCASLAVISVRYVFGSNFKELFGIEHFCVVQQQYFFLLGCRLSSRKCFRGGARCAGEVFLHIAWLLRSGAQITRNHLLSELIDLWNAMIADLDSLHFSILRDDHYFWTVL